MINPRNARREFWTYKTFTIRPLVPGPKDKRQLLVHNWPWSGLFRQFNRCTNMETICFYYARKFPFSEFRAIFSALDKDRATRSKANESWVYSTSFGSSLIKIRPLGASGEQISETYPHNFLNFSIFRMGVYIYRATTDQFQKCRLSQWCILVGYRCTLP